MCNLYNVSPKGEAERYIGKAALLPDYVLGTVGPFQEGLFLRPADGALQGVIGQWGLIRPGAPSRIELIEPKVAPGAKPRKPQPKSTNNARLESVHRRQKSRELNRSIAQLLVDLNLRPFKRPPGCRATAFAALDAPALRPLPAEPMVLAQFKPARVNIDYHVAFEGHYYSVPHQHVGAAVELRTTAGTLEVLLRHQHIAAHALNHREGGFTTVAEHMPASHRAHRQWTPAKLIGWGKRVGVATASVVRWQMEHHKHPEQGYRSCLGLMRLAREYGDERLEAACARAQSVRAPHYRSIKSILASGLDQHSSDRLGSASASMPTHDNVRNRSAIRGEATPCVS